MIDPYADDPAHLVRAAYGYVLCESDHVVAPRSTAEVAAAVKLYRAQATAAGVPLRIRATRP